MDEMIDRMATMMAAADGWVFGGLSDGEAADRFMSKAFWRNLARVAVDAVPKPSAAERVTFPKAILASVDVTFAGENNRITLTWATEGGSTFPQVLTMNEFAFRPVYDRLKAIFDAREMVEFPFIP